MQVLSTLFLLLAFALAMSVAYMAALILRRWYFNLSPRETATFALVMFDMGFITSSYLLSSVVYVLSGFLVILALFAWFLYRTYRRRALRTNMSRSGVGVSPGAK